VGGGGVRGDAVAAAPRAGFRVGRARRHLLQSPKRRAMSLRYPRGGPVYKLNPVDP
jgi:hypothetical protein